MLVLVISLLVVLLLLILLYFIYPYFEGVYKKKNYRKIFGKYIYKFCNYNDYFLINFLTLDSGDHNNFCIDHLIFADKYIYVVHDSYLDGGIKVNLNDRSWIFYSRKDKSESGKYIDNLSIKNRVKINKLAAATRIDESFFISLVVCDNDCVLDKISDFPKDDFLINLKDLKKTINEIESRDIPNLKLWDLKDAVRDISVLNKTPIKSKKNDTSIVS